MGRFKEIVIFLLVSAWSSSAFAAEPAIRIFPKPGDVVSADFLSDMFREVKPDLATTLLGTWSTQCWDGYTKTADTPGTGTLTITSLTNITFTGISCMARTSSIRLTVSQDISNTTVANADAIFSIVEITTLGNQGMFVETSDDDTSIPGNFTTYYRTASILQLELNQITLAWPDTGDARAGIEVLTRTARVPTVPTELASSATGLAVTLTWKDNSSDETQFRMLRRDSLTGNFAEISTPAVNATTYTDTVATAGTYWYRVQATNSNGNSLGSNLTKVTVE